MSGDDEELRQHRLAVHLDLKGLQPTSARLLEHLHVFAAVGFDTVLVEWEDTFPWTVDRAFRSATAYTSDEIRQFHELARSLDLEVIPLVQCLGHMETFLRPERYRSLREIPDRSDVLNPLADGARELVEALVDDVVAQTPGVRYLHLGGDEAWTFGTHAETRQFIEDHGGGDTGRAALYLHHVGPLIAALKKRGIRPMLWHDMMIHWPEEKLRAMADDVDLVVWGYAGHPDVVEGHYSTRHIERFASAGLNLWGATAYKGADGADADLPDRARRSENASGWADVSERFGFRGVVATAWSRYSTDRVQNEPIDAALDSLVRTAAILRGDDSEIDALAVLREAGEDERFLQCKAAMERLAKARKVAWDEIRMLHEQCLLEERIDPSRTGSMVSTQLLEKLDAARSELVQAADEVRPVFDGLIEKACLDEYLTERLLPVDEQYKELVKRVESAAGSGGQS